MITAEEARKQTKLNIKEHTEIEFNRAEEQIMVAIETGRYSTRVNGISNPDRLKAFMEPLGYHIEVCGEYLMVSWERLAER